MDEYGDFYKGVHEDQSSDWKRSKKNRRSGLRKDEKKRIIIAKKTRCSKKTQNVQEGIKMVKDFFDGVDELKGLKVHVSSGGGFTITPFDTDPPSLKVFIPTSHELELFPFVESRIVVFKTQYVEYGDRYSMYDYNLPQEVHARTTPGTYRQPEYISFSWDTINVIKVESLGSNNAEELIESLTEERRKKARKYGDSSSEESETGGSSL
eukprot:TRINITY_DN7541_c0_g1_i1.p1 TRINITY_DN7541_c0_g1~~TRINITY_DN7541_c0_g1_i1.p1  ORF type:complete len:209 (+),score=21.79 TRINITY_DN7541_c0_g1_i1:53-679(+)